MITTNLTVFPDDTPGAARARAPQDLSGGKALVEAGAILVGQADPVRASE
jgi:hypothetical protein